MKMNNLKTIVNNNLCISCGACSGLNPGEISLIEKKGMFIPTFNKKYSNYDLEYSICPGKGYDIEKMSEALFPDYEHSNIEIGKYIDFSAIQYNEPKYLENASSGAIMTGFANYCLTNNIVNGVIVTKFKYTVNGPVPISYIAQTEDEILESQGSKYMPVPILDILPEIRKFKGKLAFIGTPCQIAALRLLQEKDSELNKVIITIGNFCGGFRDFRESRRLFKLFNIDEKSISFFRFRGEGQPGSMLIKDSKKQIKLKYPEYARLTGYTKYKRCRLCVDATAELADLSCGDAWLPRFKNTGNNWSIIVTRSKKVHSLIEEMREKKLVTTEKITLEELKNSQKDNLTSKKIRQNSRMALYKLANKKVPYFYGGYHKNKISLLIELKITLQYKFLYFLEIIKLYIPFSKLIGRVKNEEV